jgi:hypothetical protein
MTNVLASAITKPALLVPGLSATANSTRSPATSASHRTLSTYLGTLRRHGLWLDQLAAPRPEPDWDPAHDADRKPVFLAARFVKRRPA